MRVVFPMDEIKNMDLLYIWTEENAEKLGCTGTVEHYHGLEQSRHRFLNRLAREKAHRLP